MENSSSNGSGERVLPASRRPDGTFRKEVRIRAGYIPQDEVALYEAKGSRPRNSGPVLPPGVDPEMAAQMNAKSRAARKNEKRKEKKASVPVTASEEAPKQGRMEEIARSIVEESMAGLQLSSRETSGAVPVRSAEIEEKSSTTRSGTDGESGSSKVELEKKIRALRKKIRQGESLEAASASRQRTSEEEEKIRRLESWRIELSGLEKAFNA